MTMTAPGRLPDTIRPTTYTIRLRVLPEEGEFSGKATIDLELLEAIHSVTLHALDLEIEKAVIEKEGSSQTANHSLDPSSETVTFEFPQEIAPGTAQLSIQFKGLLNQQLRGLYQVKTHGGTYAFTQFEATDARRVFPCFDEPGMKARFRLTATIPSDLSALSNMPITEEKSQGALKTVVFDETPVMSSYLLALAVSRFEIKETRVGETIVRVCVGPDQLGLGDFSLKVAAGVLPYLNEYFGLPYPYPKLDLVCVPDFAMGAMENWGAIFFRDSALLVDEKLASTSTLRSVANVITHEIVHQWFGNLVTMAWWDDLWLNESFATWLACKTVDHWRPDWNSWIEFQQQKEVPLSIDALNSTRAIQAYVESPSQIDEMFDALTYEKGAACLRMLEQFLGEIPFREGIRRYIKKFSHQNAVAQDLWTELESATGQPVSAITHDWFRQPGFPLVTATAQNSDLRHLIIHQERFHAIKDGKSRSSALWSIPLTISFGRSNGTKIHRQILKESSTELTLPSKETINWVYLNAGESGFLRTNYETSLRDRLLPVASQFLRPEERIGFLSHLWALCLNGELAIDILMVALCHFRGDQTRVVIEAMETYLEILSDQLILPADRPQFQKFVLGLFSPIWTRLGWDGDASEDDENRLARASTLRALGSLAEYEEILSELPRRLTLFWGRAASIEPTLVDPILRLSIQTDGGSLFDPYIQKLSSASTPENRDRYLTALSDYKKPKLARKLLEYVLSKDVRAQDFWRPIRLLLRNPWVQEETWEFVKQNWQGIRKKGGWVASQRIIQGAGRLWRHEWREEIEQFFKDPVNSVPSAIRSLEQTLEFIEIGIRFKKHQQSALSQWLKNHTPD